MKHQGLDAKAFGELLESVREGGAILRGQREPTRRFEVEAFRRVGNSRKHEPVAAGIRKPHGRAPNVQIPERD